MSTEEKLAPNCKMRSGRRYASDEDCAACGLGEGSACATYERLAAARVAVLRASAPPRPEPGIKAIAWEIASFLGVTPWAVDNGGVEAWERYKPLAETVMALALSAEVQELREALRYARPLLVKYAYTQGNRADFVREITAPIDAALKSETVND